ncbi:hypothetical protein X777_01723 [Ooceraea biroi]|uniref:Uncharacterized protein n=1 Tax=Ooceraea biroi TaxID=2015173 RepID=A0A026WM45_OOCBI|nr:hypothetical protein X777_01723 [Ooceraea biroi]
MEEVNSEMKVTTAKGQKGRANDEGERVDDWREYGEENAGLNYSMRAVSLQAPSRLHSVFFP